MTRTIRRLLVVAPLAALLLVGVWALLGFVRAQGVRARAAAVVVGMSREEVEGLLGPPEVVLRRPAGGVAMAWVDQLWQVDILTGPDGRVESVGYRPADSAYRRTVGP